jgi:hypothetical protein
MGWDWKNNDPFKTCSFCGQSVKRGSGWLTVGLCEEHERIFSEDIALGFKQNRLREMMMERGEIVQKQI